MDVLENYSTEAALTDVLSPSLRPVLLGLYGEVGSLLAAAKKASREGPAFVGLREALSEEFGDVAWYFCAAVRRADCCFNDISDAAGDRVRTSSVATDERGARGLAAESTGGSKEAGVTVEVDPEPSTLELALVELGQKAAELLDPPRGVVPQALAFAGFWTTYICTAEAANVDISKALKANLDKARGAFGPLALECLPTFDTGWHEDERLPSHFRILVTRRPDGRSCMKMNDVFIGDPLSDSIHDSDGYRYHDVFHFAHAAVLHWSPVVRSLLKRKRKSRPEVDEAQDGGRAIVIEEGLTAWLFSRAKKLDFFQGLQRVSLDLTRTIQEFVRGYEVEACPTKLWSRAILQGYDVFLRLRMDEGGWIVGDRERRTLTFEPKTGVGD
ncbi:MAG: hypothetical protein AAF851_09265 [Myxococcota bacterium]